MTAAASRSWPRRPAAGASATTRRRARSTRSRPRSPRRGTTSSRRTR
uniref:Uncharacterized protein n=1 Tax=Arundo donax TaxID=35708 RepID=A0A0A9DZP8_ARUDO